MDFAFKQRFLERFGRGDVGLAGAGFDADNNARLRQDDLGASHDLAFLLKVSMLGRVRITTSAGSPASIRFVSMAAVPQVMASV